LNSWTNELDNIHDAYPFSEAGRLFLLPMLTGGNAVEESDMVKFYTPKEQALIDILKAHPNSTISEMKMYIGLRSSNDVPHALNGLRIKGVLLHTDDKPPRYTLSDHQLQSKLVD